MILGLIILFGVLIYIVYRAIELIYLQKYWKEGHKVGIIKENWNKFIGINKIEGYMDDRLAISAVFLLITISLFGLIYLLVSLTNKITKKEEINDGEKGQ